MESGKKFDAGKDRWDLLPIRPMIEVVKALTHGSKKYDDNNWEQVDNPINRYYAATLRHIAAWRDGEIIDIGKNGSNLHHLAHAICNLIFILSFELKKNSGKATQKESKITEV
jgi:hypothetical protein